MGLYSTAKAVAVRQQFQPTRSAWRPIGVQGQQMTWQHDPQPSTVQLDPRECHSPRRSELGLVEVSKKTFRLQLPRGLARLVLDHGGCDVSEEGELQSRFTKGQWPLILRVDFCNSSRSTGGESVDRESGTTEFMGMVGNNRRSLVTQSNF